MLGLGFRDWGIWKQGFGAQGMSGGRLVDWGLASAGRSQGDQATGVFACLHLFVLKTSPHEGQEVTIQGWLQLKTGRASSNS